MRLTRRRVAAAAGAAALVACLAFANAANLPLAAQTMTAAELTHPCPGTATAQPVNHHNGSEYRGLAIVLPPGCANMLVQVAVVHSSTDRTGSGTSDANGQLTISSLSDNFDMHDDPGLVATVAGWALDIDWWVDPSPYIWCTVVSGGVTGATCTATVTLFTGNKPGGGTYDYYDVVVQTTSDQWLVWEVGFNLNHTFYGTPPETLGNSTLDEYDDDYVTWDTTRQGSGNNHWWAINDVVLASACSALPGSLLVRGENNGPSDDLFQQLRNNRERRFSLVLNYQSGDYTDVVNAACSP